MTAELALIREVENSIAAASASRRSEMLHKVIDLFCAASDEFIYEDLSIFDDVLIRLAADIELAARALLAKRLAPIRQAPARVVRILAFDDAIEVAGPVLMQSARLDDKTLVEIAKTKGQSHLLAISQRGALSDAVTDVLIERGDRDVVLSTADNYGASISDLGFSTLVRRSQGDDMLTEIVGARPEIPSLLLTALIAQASQTVLAKLEASHPRANAEVHRAVAEAADRVKAQVRSTMVDYTAALASVKTLQQSGRLDEHAIAAFAKAGDYAATIAGLAAMCDLPLLFVEQAMGRDRSEALMVLAKSAGLSRATAEDILLMRAEKGIIARTQIVQRLARFEGLRPATAQEIVKIFRARAQAQPSL
jgi:uncharacterized protein (DUF2336 family)